MCGRYEIARQKKLADLRKAYDDKMSFEYKNEGEAFPGDLLEVIAPDKNLKPSIYLMNWGYKLNNKLLFNARSEDIRNKPLFKDDYLRHRCVIMASCYYEWDVSKVKYKITSLDEYIYLAGIYHLNNSKLEFCVLTCMPTDKISHIHNRMPVIIKEEDVLKWLNINLDPDEVVNNSLRDLKASKVL